ncbi:hypothetical protein E3N88_25538 [Mikania micrantha]|uniref:Uncharacterized protein n=1 Tax=Mikania micrantha TaxID=192012 RepID=A0A5N6N6N4_9ASTR|nr:hypothetical protein E3N88_25538 [Mikania micrantha]
MSVKGMKMLAAKGKFPDLRSVETSFLKDVERENLDSKAKKCTFIGYGSDKIGYKLWDFERKKVIKCKHITLNEAELYKDRKKNLVIKKNYDEFEDEILEKSGESVTLEVVFDSESTRVDTDDDSNSGSTRNDIQSSSVPCYPVPQPNTQRWFRRSTRVTTPLDKYSLSANFMLLLENREPDCYTEAKEGVDYNEIFSLVVKMTTIRLVLSIVASKNLHLEQIDVKTFLHGDLDEDIYMVQLEGFQIFRKENMVCKLNKSLYGLKQALRQWYLKFENIMDRNGFKRYDFHYIKKFNKS